MRIFLGLTDLRALVREYCMRPRNIVLSFFCVSSLRDAVWQEPFLRPKRLTTQANVETAVVRIHDYDEPEVPSTAVLPASNRGFTRHRK